MSVYAMISIICVAAATIPIAIVWLVNRHRGPAMQKRIDAAMAPLMSANAKLQARVEVLERLAADPAERLRRDIETLDKAA